MKRSNNIALTILGLFVFVVIFPSKSFASTLLLGHTYVTKDGLEKYLKNVDLRWTITSDTDLNKNCPVVDNWYRNVKSGNKYSYTFLPDGSKPNPTPPQTPAPPPRPTPTPKSYPAARVNCGEEFDFPSPAITKYIGKDPNFTCKVTNDVTHDKGKVAKVNFVFQRTNCFGCRHQEATLTVMGPPPASELPPGVSTQGHWVFRDSTDNPLCGTGSGECTVKTDAGGNQYLEFSDIANNDKFAGVNFEWMPDAVTTSTPTATPTITPTFPQCGAPCTTPRPNSTECPIACPNCVPSGSGNTCQAPTGTPTPTRTLTPTPTKVPCGGPCSNSSQCVQACPICYIGANGGTCQAPTSTPTPTGGGATPTPFCECDGLYPTVNPNWTSGSSLNVVGYGKISNPSTNRAEVLNMEYQLLNITTTPVPVLTSGPITAQGPTVIPNPPAWRYTSNWGITVPGPGKYRIEEKLNCGYRQSTNPLAKSVPRETAVLQASDRKGGIFGFFSNLFGALFGRSATRIQTTPQPTLTPTPTPFDPLSSDALKLGTFNPLDPQLELGCTWAEFTVVQ